MCLECGFYKGKLVIDMAAKRKARAERLEAKKAAIAEQEAQFAPDTDPTKEQSAAIEAEVEKAEVADAKTEANQDEK